MHNPLDHIPVMLHEAVDALLASQTAKDNAGTLAKCYVDGTFGRGGHSELILSRLNPKDSLIVFDKDPQAIDAARALALRDMRVQVRHQGFTHLASLEPRSVDGILLDLGVSSPQIDDPQRGFSFRFDGPLDMRMDSSRGVTVAEWLNDANEDEIAEVIREYGEERYAFGIAKAIVARREKSGGVTTTAELATLVAGTVKRREPGQNPATRTFQALRIFINAELEELRQALDAALRVLKPQGRLVVISFHSLEDRIVKQFIELHARDRFDRSQPFAEPKVLLLKAVSRVKPSTLEVQNNVRARSAIMRVAERLEASC